MPPTVTKLKRQSGKIGAFWLWAKTEGLGAFKRRYGVNYDYGSEHQTWLGEMWQALPAEKRTSYQSKAQEVNAPPNVAARRQNQERRRRNTNQQLPQLVMERKRETQLRDAEVSHRRAREYTERAQRPAPRHEFQAFTGLNPLFLWGKAVLAKRMSCRESVYARLSFQGEISKDNIGAFLQSQTIALIKVNIFDSVQENYEARVHPSEVSIIVFNLMRGVMAYRTFLIEYSSRALYGCDGIPTSRRHDFFKQEEITGLFHDMPLTPDHWPVDEAYDAIFKFLGQYSDAYLTVQPHEWNKVSGSLFFLAHAARNQRGALDHLHDRLPFFYTFEDVVLQMHIRFQEKKDDSVVYRRPESDDYVDDDLNIPLMPKDSIRFLCVCHKHSSPDQAFHCTLARAVSTAQCFFNHCWRTRLAGFNPVSRQEFLLCEPYIGTQIAGQGVSVGTGPNGSELNGGVYRSLIERDRHLRTPDLLIEYGNEVSPRNPSPYEGEQTAALEHRMGELSVDEYRSRRPSQPSAFRGYNNHHIENNPPIECRDGHRTRTGLVFDREETGGTYERISPVGHGADGYLCPMTDAEVEWCETEKMRILHEENRGRIMEIPDIPRRLYKLTMQHSMGILFGERDIGGIDTASGLM